MGKLGRVIVSGLCIAVTTGSLVAVWKRQDISDWLALRDYEPSAEISALAERASMNDKSKKLFYVHDPQLLDKTQFNLRCDVSEKTIVLGCYNGSGIYLFDIDDPKLDGIKEVTSAHEMLHAAYDRLSSKEKERLKGMLEKAFMAVTDERIRNLVEQYRQKDASSLTNEMHSIFATEVRNLQPELEEYYKQYFRDRMQIVALSEKYEQVFVDLETEVEKRDADLTLRKSEIMSRETEIEREGANLQEWRRQLDRLASEGKNEEYNSQIPGYNSAVAAYNSELQTLRSLIRDYNRLVEERNQLAYQQNKLVQSIDSKATDL